MSPMTFDGLCALDLDALNCAIEHYCYPAHAWTRDQLHASGPWIWTLDSPDVGGALWSTVPHLHHTASWDRTMDLAFRYSIGLWPLVPRNDGWLVQYPGNCTALAAQTAEEARVQMCRLAVWRAMQEKQEVSNGPRPD